MKSAVIATPVGNLLIESCDGIIKKITRTDSIPYYNKELEPVISQINEYFSGVRKSFTFCISPEGTDFQKRVWTEVAKIPFGETATYGQIAIAVGSPGASRAVGTAMGKNPILLAIPCHRVVASTGLGGFGLGIENKRLLLSLEKTLEKKR